MASQLPHLTASIQATESKIANLEQSLSTKKQQLEALRAQKANLAKDHNQTKSAPEGVKAEGG